MKKIVDPYGVLNIRVTWDDTVMEEVTEETMKKWRKESELFAKYGSEMIHKYGLEGLEKIDNEPKYIEDPEEKEKIMSSTSKTTGTMY